MVVRRDFDGPMCYLNRIPGLCISNKRRGEGGG